MGKNKLFCRIQETYKQVLIRNLNVYQKVNSYCLIDFLDFHPLFYKFTPSVGATGGNFTITLFRLGGKVSCFTSFIFKVIFPKKRDISNKHFLTASHGINKVHENEILETEVHICEKPHIIYMLPICYLFSLGVW